MNTPVNPNPFQEGIITPIIVLTACPPIYSTYPNLFLLERLVLFHHYNYFHSPLSAKSLHLLKLLSLQRSFDILSSLMPPKIYFLIFHSTYVQLVHSSTNHLNILFIINYDFCSNFNSLSHYV